MIDVPPIIESTARIQAEDIRVGRRTPILATITAPTSTTSITAASMPEGNSGAGELVIADVSDVAELEEADEDELEEMVPELED